MDPTAAVMTAMFVAFCQSQVVAVAPLSVVVRFSPDFLTNTDSESRIKPSELSFYNGFIRILSSWRLFWASPLSERIWGLEMGLKKRIRIDHIFTGAEEGNALLS